MATSFPAPPAPASVAESASHPSRFPTVAGPVHTVVLSLALAAWCFWFKILADQLAAAPHPNRLRIYAITIVCEWLLFAFAVWGVRRHGAPLSLVLGERWQSTRQVLRDIGVALAFWVVALLALGGVVWLLRATKGGKDLPAFVPHRPLEIAVWLAVAATAGICEETLFRGYLQRQFIAFTRNIPAGILLSAICFGAAHIYQGIRMVIAIAFFGSLFGILAWWRNSTRPGMIAHAWQDTLAGIVTGLTHH